MNDPMLNATVEMPRPIPRGESNTPEVIDDRWAILDATPGARAALADDRAFADAGRYQRNIENYIGTVKVPVGIAGPLRVNGRHAQGDYYVPLATTEAALVASYSRGARLISTAGGCNTAVIEEAVTRAPGFVFRSLDEAIRFSAWIETQQHELERLTAATTRYGRFLRASPTIEGNHVYLTLEFTTGDAAGQNMVTFATEAILAHLAQHAPDKPQLAFVEANHSGEKKANARAFQRVRGKRVAAEVRVSPALVLAGLHTTPQRMADFWRMSALGCVLSGAVGVHGHYANALAALYLACGQDVACVAESATGVTRFEVEASGDLYAAVTLPNLIVGTIGGGTALPSQHACLEIIGLAGAGKSNALAEVAAALCLAGELSIVGAVCANEFARAHRQLARGLAAKP